MRTIPVIRASGEHHSLDLDPLCSADGTQVAAVSQAPILLVAKIVAEARETVNKPLSERYAIFLRAAELLITGKLGGETPEDYCSQAAETTGLPSFIFRDTLSLYSNFLKQAEDYVRAQQPRCAKLLTDLSGETSNTAIWVPRGKVLGVVAPSNHPATHLGWLQALAFGYNIVVKPGRKDPYTPLRLIRALVEAGLSAGEVAFTPGDHSAAETLATASDLALIYGGLEAEGSYVNNRRVLVRGPGRAKVLVAANCNPSAELVNFLADCVSADAGVRCTNASAILVREGHESLAHALARKLSQLQAFPSADDRAQLPVLPVDEAHSVRAALDVARGQAEDLCLHFSAPVEQISKRAAALRPAVILCDSGHASFGREFPFPCVWVAPWHEDDGIRPLRNSLVVSLLTDDAGLIEAASLEPSIRKVHVGRVPTHHSMLLLPHDVAIAEFLYESKGYAKRGDLRP
jgi:acyl-CoA reductase-like NAD-dependent aldehyde dehydrogenase